VSWRDDSNGAVPSSLPDTGNYPGPKLLTKQKCRGQWAVAHYAKHGAHFGDLARVAHATGHLPQFVASQMMGAKAGPLAKVRRALASLLKCDRQCRSLFLTLVSLRLGRYVYVYI
jgi:hypothetical protein